VRTLGVFLIPPAEHPLYRIGSALLGYDVYRGERCTPLLADALDRATLDRWLGEAPRFGLHLTVGGAALSYDAADVGEVKARLAWVASRTAPFTLTNGRIHDTFHANPRALVLTHGSPDGALRRLHRRVVTTVSPLHAASTYARIAGRLSEEARRVYWRTGEPWALELFSPHWTLASGLPDRAAWETLRAAVLRRADPFADAAARTLDVTAVHLVEREPADGYCRVAETYALGGAPAS
jgi:2'-5' RNA ligase